MSVGQSSGIDPFHLRELAEARAERSERLYEVRARFGEPISQGRPRSARQDLAALANDLSESAVTIPVGRGVELFPCESGGQSNGRTLGQFRRLLT